MTDVKHSPEWFYIVGYPNRAKNPRIYVSETEQQLGWSSTECARIDNGAFNKYYTELQCYRPMAGRYVQIQLFTSNFLNLQEVEVNGYEVPAE